MKEDISKNIHRNTREQARASSSLAGLLWPRTHILCGQQLAWWPQTSGSEHAGSSTCHVLPLLSRGWWDGAHPSQLRHHPLTGRHQAVASCPPVTASHLSTGTRARRSPGGAQTPLTSPSQTPVHFLGHGRHLAKGKRGSEDMPGSHRRTEVGSGPSGHLNDFWENRLKGHVL